MRRFMGLFSVAIVCVAAQAPPPDGRAIFQKNCALCHKPDADNRTPTLEAVKRVPNGAIIAALETGAMKAQGATLTAVEKQAVADFLSPRASASAEPAASNSCAPGAAPLSNLSGWNGWGVDLVNTRMQTPEAAGLRAEDIPKLK